MYDQDELSAPKIRKKGVQLEKEGRITSGDAIYSC